MLVGAPAGDDAGVYRLDDDMALVQTVDVFSPSVDDPYTFGQIAAANSLSDVYAMGGRPITALSIVGFPLHTVPDDALHEILRGGIDKMAEAGVAVVGGHSINDSEIKAGFAVTGLDPSRQDRDQRRRPAGRLPDPHQAAGHGHHGLCRADRPRAGRSGRKPPRDRWPRSTATRPKLMIECGAHACTDVTGFGLMGHLGAMAAASKVDVEIVWDDLPLLPGVLAMPGRGNRLRGGRAESRIVGPLPGRGRRRAAADARPLLRSANFRRTADRRCRRPRRTICWRDCMRRAWPRRRSSAKSSAQARAASFSAPTDGGRFRPLPVAAIAERTTDNTGDEQYELLRRQSRVGSFRRAMPAAAAATERKFQEFLQAAAAPARWTRRPSRPSPLRCRSWPAASRA